IVVYFPLLLPLHRSTLFPYTTLFRSPIYYIIINKTLTLGRKFFAGLVATISLTVMLGILNYFFVLPAYLTVMGFDISSVTGSMRNYIIYFLIPFNIIKGGLVSSIIFIMYERMKSWLIKQRCALGTESTSQHSNSNISINS